MSVAKSIWILEFRGRSKRITQNPNFLTKTNNLWFCNHGRHWLAILCFTFRWIMRKRRFKRHVLWTIEETRLTFEELSIMLTRLKACMNSRPLYPISSDPKDFNPLIPGLFNNWSITYLDVTDVKMNQLSRFQLLQAMQQHFWDYLFHQRNKWRHCIWNNCNWDKVNTKVLIKEENCHYCDGNWSKVDQFIKIHLKNNSKIIVIIIQGFIIINYNYHSLSFKFI